MRVERETLKWRFLKVKKEKVGQKEIQKVKSRTDVVDSTLEREKPRSSVRHRLLLAREKSRSSVDCTLPEVLQAMVSARA